MKETLLTLSRSLLSWGVAITAFLVPLTYSGATVDLFDFPKQIVLYTAVLLLLAAWLTRMWIEGEVHLTKTPIDLPLLLFTAIAVISTILSFNQIGFTGITGFFGRFHGGLASLISLTLLYYITVNNIKTRPEITRVIWALVLAGGVLALVGLMQALGVPLFPGEEARGRTFTPAGNLQALSVYLSVSVIVALGLLINRSDIPAKEFPVHSETTPVKRGRGRPPKYEAFTPAIPLALLRRGLGKLKDTLRSGNPEGSAAFAQTLQLPKARVVLVPLLALMGAELIFLNITAGWVTLVTGVVVLVFWSRPRLLAASIRPLGILLAVFAVIFVIVHIIDIAKRLPILAPIAPEAMMDIRSSWVVAAHTVRDYPIFGSGPGSFFYDFTRFRAAAYNQTDTWNLRFTVPHNEYFLYLATIGIAGLFAAVTLGIRFFVFAVMTALKGADSIDHPLKVGATAAAIAIFIGQAFFAHNTTTATAFMLVLGITMSLERLLGKAWVDDLKLTLALAPSGGAVLAEEPHFVSAGASASRGKREVMPSLLFYPGILVVLLLFFFVSRHLSANLAYREALAAAARNDGTATYQLQLKAIRESPFIDQYHLGFAQTNLLLAAALVTKPNPSDQERQTATALVDQAIREARTAADLAPLHVANWEMLAQIYRNIAGSVPDAASWALQAYQQALTTDPPNPQLRLDVGGLLFAAQQYDAAIQQFQLAVQLKPNLANAWYNLANAFAKKEMYHEAMQAYQQAKPYVTPGSAEDKQLEQEIALVRAKIDKNAGPSPAPRPTPEPNLTRPEPSLTRPEPEGDVAGESTEASPTPSPSPEP